MRLPMRSKIACCFLQRPGDRCCQRWIGDAMIGILLLALTWAVLVALLYVVHRIVKPHPTAETIRRLIFSAEMVVLTLLFFSFFIIGLYVILRVNTQLTFLQSAAAILCA